MTLTPEQQHDIIAQESAWIDDGFASIDLSGFPSLNKPSADKHDDRFAKDWRDTPFSASAKALRTFVSDPDSEALERIGTETGNPTFLADVHDERAERAALEFKMGNPSCLPIDDNFRAMVTTLAYNALPASEQSGELNDVADRLIAQGHWTVGNFEAVYQALDREGILDKAAGEPRNLTERERLSVARLAQAGRTEDAISEFLS